MNFDRIITKPGESKSRKEIYEAVQRNCKHYFQPTKSPRWTSLHTACLSSASIAASRIARMVSLSLVASIRKDVQVNEE